MFIKEILLKVKLHIDTHTLIVRDFNTPLSPMDKSSRQKLNREILELTDIVNEMELQASADYFVQTQKNTLSSQHLMEHSPKFSKITTYLFTKQVSKDRRKLK